MSMWKIGLVVALSVVLGACGGGSSASSVAPQYAGAVQSDDAARGEEVYAAACGICHPGTAPALADIGWSAGAVRQQIREGGAGMPPMTESRLSAEDMEAVLAYLATIGAVQ